MEKCEVRGSDCGQKSFTVLRAISNREAVILHLKRNKLGTFST